MYLAGAFMLLLCVAHRHRHADLRHPARPVSIRASARMSRRRTRRPDVGARHGPRPTRPGSTVVGHRLAEWPAMAADVGLPRHKLAMVGLWVIGVPLPRRDLRRVRRPRRSDRAEPARSPSPAADDPLHRPRPTTGLRFRPYVYELDRERDPETAGASAYVHVGREDLPQVLRQGRPPTCSGACSGRHDRTSFATEKPRDQLLPLRRRPAGHATCSAGSIYGTRISMSIGLVGVDHHPGPRASSSGGISGYYGGRIDALVQRLIEFVAQPADHPALAGAGRGAAARAGRSTSSISSSP